MASGQGEIPRHHSQPARFTLNSALLPCVTHWAPSVMTPLSVSEATQRMVTSMLVRNLCCHRDVGMALVSLASLQTYSEEPVSLVIHDDGSLTDEDCQLLETQLQNTRVVRRRDADAIVEPVIASYPLLLEARRKIPFFLKLLDLYLVHPDPVVRFVDSDILFQRPFQGLFDLDSMNATAVFMTDIRSAFGFRLKQFWPLGPLRFTRRLNSGIFTVPASSCDFDFLHSTLQHTGIAQALHHRGWYEQGLWSAIGFQLHASLYLESQLALSETANRIPQNTIGLHLTGTARRTLFDLAKGGPVKCSPVTIQATPGAEFTLLEATYIAVAARVKQRLGLDRT
jgi:hypothetical protein